MVTLITDCIMGQVLTYVHGQGTKIRDGEQKEMAMGHMIMSILRRICPGIVMVVRQWRALHAQNWGWGPDEQPRAQDEKPSATDVPSRCAETHKRAVDHHHISIDIDH